MYVPVVTVVPDVLHVTDAPAEHWVQGIIGIFRYGTMKQR